MDRYEWCGVEPGSEVKNVSGRGGGKKMLKRYKMYYNEAVGKIEMIGEPDYDVGDFRISRIIC